MVAALFKVLCMGELLVGRRIEILAAAGEETVVHAGTGDGHGAVRKDIITHFLRKHELDVAVAEEDVGFSVVPGVGAGAVLGGAFLGVGVVGVGGQARGIDAVALVEEAVGVVFAFGVLAGALSGRHAGGGAEAIGGEDGECAGDAGRADGVADPAVTTVAGAGIAEELIVVAVGVVAAIVVIKIGGAGGKLLSDVPFFGFAGLGGFVGHDADC